MHEKVFHVSSIWELVGLCGKPYKAFIIKIDPEWIYACYQNVDSEIKFQSFVEKGIRDILLHHTPFLLFYVCWVLSKVNTSSLTPSLWLYNKGLN